MPKATRHPPPIEDDPRGLVRERLNGELHAVRDAVVVAARYAGIYDDSGVDDLLGEVVRQVMEHAAKYDAGRAIGQRRKNDLPIKLGFVVSGVSPVLPLVSRRRPWTTDSRMI
jgi:hypothetical protein